MNPRFAPFVERIAHEASGDPWALHWDARNAKARGEDVIVLSVGDPDLNTPPAVIDAAVAAMRSGDTHYTESAGRPRLRAAVAALHTRRTGQPARAENAIVLGGCQNGLFVASMLLAGPGDEVVALDPMYATYPATIRASGATLVPVEVPAAKGFHPDLAAIEAAITPRTRAIFLATPNNPTGVVFSDEDVDGIAAIARRRSLWVVSDEVYAGIAEGGRVPSLAARLPDQVLTLGSLSKTHAMTGWRAGWIVGPEDFIAHAEQLALNMLYGLPGFVQEAAQKALEIAAEAETAVRHYCALRRERLYRALEGIPGLRPIWPDAGMFMLLDVRPTGLTAGDFVRGLYQAERVSLLDGAAFGRATEGFVRACFAADEAELDEAARRIRRYAASLGAR